MTTSCNTCLNVRAPCIMLEEYINVIRMISQLNKYCIFYLISCQIVSAVKENYGNNFLPLSFSHRIFTFKTEI